MVFDPSKLQPFGWKPCFFSQLPLAELERLRPARVTEVHRGRYLVHTGDAPISVELSGRFRHRSESAVDYPTVGDFVLLDGERPLITDLLPRRTLLQRGDPGLPGEAQGIAANLDTLFLVTAMNRDFNPRRLERYLTLAGEAGVAAVIVLTKRDLCDDPDPYLETARALPGVEAVIGLDAQQEPAATLLAPWLAPGQTVAFAGSSGVGKTTLLNNLLGGSHHRTAPARASDERGRHTTSHRALFLLPGGGCVIDVPGLRGVALPPLAGAVARRFADLDELARECRYRDCTHGEEPGCAVQAAVAAGSVDPDHLRSWVELAREEAKQLARAAKVHERREKERRFGRECKAILAEKRRQRGE